MARDLFIGFGTSFWNGSIYNAPTFTGTQIVGEFLPFFIKMTPFFGSLVSVVLVFLINSAFVNKKASKAYENFNFLGVYRFLSHKWYFDTVYNRLVNRPLLTAAYNTVFALIDKGLLETFGPTGLGDLSIKAGAHITAQQTGRVFEYAWLMLGIFYFYVLVIHLL